MGEQGSVGQIKAATMNEISLHHERGSVLLLLEFQASMLFWSQRHGQALRPRKSLICYSVSIPDGSAAQASLPAPLQYPSLLAGNEVGRIGNEGGVRVTGGRGAPACSSRGHHGRCFMLQHHFHQRSRRPAGPPKALPPPADGSPPSLHGSPPVPDISHFSSVSASL